MTTRRWLLGLACVIGTGCHDGAASAPETPGDQAAADRAAAPPSHWAGAPGGLYEIPCLAACDPAPTFSARPLKRNEHGGYGFLDVQPQHCGHPDVGMPVKKCWATCDGHDRLGEVTVDYGEIGRQRRAAVCQAVSGFRGQPSTGSCTSPSGERVVWDAKGDRSRLKLEPSGTLVLDCGIPATEFLPRAPGM